MNLTRKRLQRLSQLVWPVSEQLASPIMQLLLTPLLLHRMGAAQFGLWILALTPLVAASSLSLGRSVSLLAVVPRWSGGALEAHIRPTIWRILRLTAAISSAAMLVLFAIGPWLAPLLPKTLEDPVLYIGLVIALAAVNEAENTVTFALKGLGQFKIAALAELSGRGLQVLLTFAAVSEATGSQAGVRTVDIVIAIAIAISVMKFGIKGYALHRNLPRPSLLVSNTHADATRDVRHTGFWMWLQVMCGLVFYSFDRWVVSYFFGAAALSAYAICSQLSQLSHALAAAAAQPLVPWAAARSASLADPGVAAAVKRTAIAASMAACVLPGIVLICAQPLLSIWISPAFAAEHSETALALGGVFLLLAINVPFFNLLIGFGQAKSVSIITVAAAIFFVLACLIAQPENLFTVVALKLGYAIVCLASIALVFRHMHRSSQPPRHGKPRRNDQSQA